MRTAPLPVAILVAVLSMSAASCSRNPVAPDPAAPSQPGTTSSQVCEIPGDDGPNSGGGVPNAMSVTLQPGTEATLFAGRFTLQLHKNSLNAPAQITLTVADQFATQCQVEVSPPQAFQVLPELIANMSDLNVDYDVETMFYLANNQWDEYPGVASHPNQLNVTAKLTGEATCRVGPRPKTIKKNAAGI